MNVTPEIVAHLAPKGVLRVGINMSNFLLVNGRSPDGGPTGVSPSMGKAIADRLGVPVRYVTFPNPGLAGDAAGTDAWDIVNIGAEPQRAEKIAFTNAYAEIECTYLVPAGSPITSIAEVDRPGIRIAVSARAAYDLWLERNIKQATLIRGEGLDATMHMFGEQRLEVLAGLRPRLLTDAEFFPGSRILDGNFMAVQQAVGTLRGNSAAEAFLSDFVEEAKRSGLVARFIQEHGVRGLSVAPVA
ncbi:ABC transporter substrate-binding protein [Roseococcus sp. YIM B11640]|uniref:ABC transporter substrate-binding protein n=1 Tax=Roseococcus sp. YIM B11640 TaxID=3133973 RepID=UPI003C7C03D6